MQRESTGSVRDWAVAGIALALLAAGTVVTLLGVLSGAAEETGPAWTRIVMMGVGFAVGMGGVGLGVTAAILQANDARLRSRRAATNGAGGAGKEAGVSRRHVFVLLCLLAAAGLFLAIVVFAVAFVAVRYWLFRG